MNTRQARISDLHYTGCSECYRSDKVRDRAKELRKQGYRAVVVTERCERTRRGLKSEHYTSYSVYVEQKYFDDCSIVQLKKNLSHIPSRIQLATEEFQKTLAAIQAEELNIKDNLKALSEKTYSTK